ncbi:hypothetical protein J6590_001124 [Homalodisca vitripennis]|nr:hypothetical protein J6590_001124 [Homalodisca vitripennis]
MKPVSYRKGFVRLTVIKPRPKPVAFFRRKLIRQHSATPRHAGFISNPDLSLSQFFTRIPNRSGATRRSRVSVIIFRLFLYYYTGNERVYESDTPGPRRIGSAAPSFSVVVKPGFYTFRMAGLALRETVKNRRQSGQGVIRLMECPLPEQRPYQYQPATIRLLIMSDNTSVCDTIRPARRHAEQRGLGDSAFDGFILLCSLRTP